MNKYHPTISTHSLALKVLHLDLRGSQHQSQENLSAIIYGDKPLQVEQQL